MKLCTIPVALILWSSLLTPAASQNASNAVDEPSPILSPALLQTLIPPNCPVRNMQQTKLSLKGELIITCTRDFLSDGVSTHILVTDGNHSLLKDIDLNDQPMDDGGIRQLDTAKEVVNKSRQHVFVVVFATSGDGSGSEFLVIGYRNRKYEVLLHRLVSLGRIVFHSDSGSMEIWGSLDGKCPDGPSCVWCMHRYKIETYSWHSSRFTRKYSRLTNRCLNPDPIVSDPIIVDRKHL